MVAPPDPLPSKRAQRGRSRLFRADVTTSLAQQPRDQAAAESRLNLERGAFNISPWGIALGVIGAVFSLLFALYAALDARQAQREREQPRQGAESNTEPGETSTAPAPTWIDVELE